MLSGVYESSSKVPEGIFQKKLGLRVEHLWFPSSCVIRSVWLWSFLFGYLGLSLFMNKISILYHMVPKFLSRFISFSFYVSVMMGKILKFWVIHFKSHLDMPFWKPLQFLLFRNIFPTPRLENCLRKSLSNETQMEKEKGEGRIEPK